MTFKKLCSAILAAAMVIALGLPALAAGSSSSAGSFVDEDGYLVDRDTFTPGQTYYFVIGNTADYGMLTDRDYLTFSLKKTSNSKYITDAALVEKRFGGDRMVCIRFSVKDFFTADEYKVQMEASFRARVDLDITNRADVAAGRAFPKFVPKSKAPTTYAARIDATTAYNNAADTLAAVEQEIAKLNSELSTLAYNLGESAPYVPNPAKAAEAQKAYQDAVAKAQTLNAQVTRQSESVRLLEQNVNSDKIPPEKVTELTNTIKTLDAQIAAARAHLTALGFNADTYASEAYIVPADPLVTPKLVPYFNNVVAKESVKDSGPVMPQSFTNWNTYRASYLAAYPGDTAVLPALAKGSFSYPDPVTGLPKPYFDNRIGVLNALAALKNNLKAAIDTANAQIATINGQLNGTIPIPTVFRANPALETAKAELVRLQGLKAAADNEASAANVRAVNYTTYNSKATTLTAKQPELLTAQSDFAFAKKRLEDETSNVPGVAFLNSGQTFTHSFTIWVGNESVESDDAEFDVGQSGQVIRPIKGATNTVRWNDSYGMVASVRFIADSDSSFFFPQLSTRWDSADYADYFDDQDAYLYDFTTNPTLPATSRGELQLRNPYVDDNGYASVKARDIVIYQIVDGDLDDVTRLFNPIVNDDGIAVLSTRTRKLGTYIVCEEEVYFDDYDDDFDDDIEVLDPSSPVIPSVDINNNEKPVPNTGR